MDIPIAFSSYVVNNPTNLVGVLMPVVIDYLNKDVKTTRERFIVSILACVGAAVALHFKELLYGSLNDLLFSVGMIFTESQAVYHMYFKDSWAQWKVQTKLFGWEEEGTEPVLPG